MFLPCLVVAHTQRLLLNIDLVCVHVCRCVCVCVREFYRLVADYAGFVREADFRLGPRPPTPLSFSFLFDVVKRCY